MANDFTRNPFFLDTEGLDLYTGRVFIRTITARNRTAGTLTMRMQDANGLEIFNAEVPGASQIDRTVDGWVDGLEIAVGSLAANTEFLIYIN